MLIIYTIDFNIQIYFHRTNSLADRTTHYMWYMIYVRAQNVFIYLFNLVELKSWTFIYPASGFDIKCNRYSTKLHIQLIELIRVEELFNRHTLILNCNWDTSFQFKLFDKLYSEACPIFYRNELINIQYILRNK